MEIFLIILNIESFTRKDSMLLEKNGRPMNLYSESVDL